MGFFEQNAGLFFICVAVVSGVFGYIGSMIHNFKEQRWTRRMN